MAKYTEQLVLQFLTGDKKGDGVIVKGSEAIEAKTLVKHKGLESQIIAIHLSKIGTGGKITDEKLAETLRTALGELTGESRLYIRGHGSWEMLTVGGVDARLMALILKKHGLKAVKLVSVTACTGGVSREKGPPSTALGKNASRARDVAVEPVAGMEAAKSCRNARGRLARRTRLGQPQDHSKGHGWSNKKG